MQLSDRSVVTVNPYDGAILSRSTGPNRTQKLLGQIHQLHLRMAPEPRGAWVKAGKQIISSAGLLLCILAPTGFILWWRTKRASIRWKKASWFRRCFDAHHVIGVYAGLFLWIAGFSGILIGFDWGEEAIYKLTGSAGPSRPSPPASTAAPGGNPITVDRAMEIARQAIPAGIVEIAQLPRGPKGTFFFVLRVPEETTGRPLRRAGAAGARLPDRFSRVLLDPIQPVDSHRRHLRHNRTRDHLALQPAFGRNGVDRGGDMAEETRGVAIETIGYSVVRRLGARAAVIGCPQASDRRDA
jgi:hypothetical protein